MPSTQVAARLSAPTDRRVLYVREVSGLLGLDPRTLYAGIARGEIPSTSVSRRVVVPRSWVDHALDPGRDGGAP